MWIQVAFVIAFVQVALGQICPTPLTNVVVEESLIYDLPGNSFGPDVVSAGAYVMVLFTNSTTTFSQISFNHGATFPRWTRRELLPKPLVESKMNLLSDGRDVIAVGYHEDKMINYEFSFGDFSWKNGSTIFPVQASFLECASKRGLFVCAVGDSIDFPPAVDEGIQVFSMHTQNTNKSSPSFTATWTKRSAPEMPTCKARFGIASDGESFMICSAGDLEGVRIVCSASVDGTAEYTNTPSDPASTGFNETTVVRLASNGVLGSYVLMYFSTADSEVSVITTLDSGDNWSEGLPLFPGLTSIPDYMVFTNKYFALYQQGGEAYAAFQNSSTPIQFDETFNIVNGTKVSLASGNFGNNFFLAFKDAAEGIYVTSCIPTAAPTFAPSPSPTSNDATFLSGVSRALFSTVVAVAYLVRA